MIRKQQIQLSAAEAEDALEQGIRAMLPNGKKLTDLEIKGPDEDGSYLVSYTMPEREPRKEKAEKVAKEKK